MKTWLRQLKEARARPVPEATFLTSYCNFPHRLSDGKPIEHNCYVLDPTKLRLEARGLFDQIEGPIVKQPPKEMVTGVKRREFRS